MYGAPNLTLIDLPGITYKNEKLTENIKRIIEKYTIGSSTLILLVIPANSDFTTSEAISLVRKHQDYKSRTMPIITKIDLGIQCDKRIFEKVTGNELELTFEPIVVLNRTQDELEANVSFEEIRKKELDLIENHKDLKNLPDETKGTDQLIKRLVTIQKKFLLETSKPIKEKILQKKTELLRTQRKLPPPAFTIFDKMDRFKECINKLQNDFSGKLKGRVMISNEKKFNILSRLKEMFDNSIKIIFSKTQKYFLTSDCFFKLKEILSESKGINLSNFIDPEIFNEIIKVEIEEISKGIFVLLEDCKEYMNIIFEKIITNSFQNYPALKDAICYELSNSLFHQSNLIEISVNDLLECEMDAAYTTNSMYEKTLKKLQSKKKKNFEKFKEARGLSNGNSKGNCFKNSVFSMEVEDEENAHIKNLQYSCIAYWKIIEKRLADYYHKLILNKMVFFYSKNNNLSLILEKKFSPNNEVQRDWISEDFSISKKRKDVAQSLENLEKALGELHKIG